MNNPLKKLASQTVIYGLPTIVGRLLYFLLNPLYTYNFPAEQFGVVTSGYAYTSFLLVLLTYGMETTLFRFSQTEIDKNKVYSTSLISVFFTSAIFIVAMSMFSSGISQSIKFTGHAEYVVWFSIIVGIDALCAIPFAKLREQVKPKRFAIIKTINIFVYIGLNLFFILFCKRVHESASSSFKPFVEHIYNPEIGIGYIFISNLIASILTMILLLPEFFQVKLNFDSALWKRMMPYALPLLVAGLAGMVNETLDRILLTHLLPENTAMVQTGIYGACYKVAMIMTIFVQTFRFAAEPFFFSHSEEKNARQTYASIMKYFVIICSAIFLAVMLNIQWIQYFAGSEEFRAGITVVPILLLANMFLGIFYNQSIWYKLTAKTSYGAYLTIFGAVITIVLNIYWIPRIGYLGCAWATLICYSSMMVVSFILGNKHYSVDYDLKRILGYIALSIILFFISDLIKTESNKLNLILNNFILFGFVITAWMIERKNLMKKKV